MFTAGQYRAKAAKSPEFLNRPGSPKQSREFRSLQRIDAPLAENEELGAGGAEAAPSGRRTNRDNRTGLAEQEEKILKCLGAALIMRWNTLPTKLQRELFDHAGSIGDLYQTASLREPIARFLHDHKDDDQETRFRGRQLVGHQAFKSGDAAAKLANAISLGLDTRTAQEPGRQQPAVDVLDELWRFSCETPDAPHLSKNRYPPLAALAREP
jgi:hypothetical protein